VSVTMGNCSTNKSKYESVQLMDHLKISMSNTEKARLELSKSWKRFYGPRVYKLCRNREDGSTNRKKLAKMCTMCGSMKIANIINLKKEVWSEEDNHNECESVYFRFDVAIDVRYNYKKQRLSLSTIFDDEFSVFDDNKMDKYSEHWHHSLAFVDIDTHKLWSLFLTEALTGNEKVSSIITGYLMNEREKESMRSLNVIENGDVDSNNLMLVAGVIGIHQSDTQILSEILNVLWRWFLSKEIMMWRKRHVDERMVWRRPSSSTENDGK